MGSWGKWLFSASVAFWRCLFTLVKTVFSPSENRCVAVQVCGFMCLQTLYKDWPQSYLRTCGRPVCSTVPVSICRYSFVCALLRDLGFRALKVWINEELWLLEHKTLPRVKTPPAPELIQLSLSVTTVSVHTKTPEEQAALTRDMAASGTGTWCERKEGRGGWRMER